jgi:phage shock protein E
MDINEGLKLYEEVRDSADLFDVREAGEYSRGHLPGAVNLPLTRLDEISQAEPDKDHKIFLYCASGYRSAQAESALRAAGYTDVTNIGGIMDYTGPVEK